MPQNDNEVLKNFIEQRGDNLSTLLKEDQPKNIKSLEAGPLNKNDYTINFEQVVRAFLANKADPSKPEVKFSVDNGKLYAEMEGEKYDMSATIKFANMNHFKFNETDADNYMKFIQSDTAVHKPSLDNSEDIPTMEDFENHEKADKYPDALSSLNWAEKCAINIYTGSFYTSCNPILRGNLSKIEGADSDTIGEILATAAMTSSGLNKASKSVPRFSFRIEENFDDEITQKRIDAVNNGGDVTQESGFFSTADGADNQDANEMTKMLLEMGGGTGILLSDLSGKYVASISKKPEEFEFIIPPTQIQWVAHYQNDAGSHFFHARPVQTLSGLSPEQKQRTIHLDTDEGASPIVSEPDEGASAIVKETPATQDSSSFKQQLQAIKGTESSDELSDEQENNSGGSFKA